MRIIAFGDYTVYPLGNETLFCRGSEKDQDIQKFTSLTSLEDS